MAQVFSLLAIICAYVFWEENSPGAIKKYKLNINNLINL